MELSTNLMGFYQHFGVEKTIDIFAEAGFTAVDFNLDQPMFMEDLPQSYFEAIKNYAAARGITFPQTHAPFATTFKDEEKNARRFQELVRSLEQSSWLGADMVVVHPANHRKYRDENCFEEMLAYNVDLYRRLAPHAKEFGVRIAIENIPGSVTDKPEGFLQLLEQLDSQVFTVCFDVGHAHMMGLDEAAFIRALGSRIGCTHIHDNNGTSDGHTLPYYGTTDWNAVMEAFRQVGYQGSLSYEAGVFAMNLPVPLRPDAAKLMAKVGRHLMEIFQN